MRARCESDGLFYELQIIFTGIPRAVLSGMPPHRLGWSPQYLHRDTYLQRSLQNCLVGNQSRPKCSYLRKDHNRKRHCHKRREVGQIRPRVEFFSLWFCVLLFQCSQKITLTQSSLPIPENYWVHKEVRYVQQHGLLHPLCAPFGTTFLPLLQSPSSGRAHGYRKCSRYHE